MNQIVSEGVVLTRTNFGEADRILTMLTPDHGKIRVMAKGVRKIKSKLAGGIELFSVSSITFIPGRGEISTLVSSRLKTHFGHIVHDINRTMLGYELLKRINRVTEDAAGGEYFSLLVQALEELDDEGSTTDSVEFWFTMQLLKITGHAPNLRTDTSKRPLSAEHTYRFDYDAMAFQPAPKGIFTANHIKLMRLSYSSKPAVLRQVNGVSTLLPDVLQLAKLLINRNVRV